MPITVPIDRKSYRMLAKMFRDGTEIVCLDQPTYLRALLVGQELAKKGKTADPKKVKLQKPDFPASAFKPAIDPTSKDRSKLVGHTFRVRKNGEQESRRVIDFTLGGGVTYRVGRNHWASTTEYDPAKWDAWAKDAKCIK